MKSVIIVVAGTILAAGTASAVAEDPQPVAPQPSPQAQKATVTKIEVKRPARRAHMVRRFSPPAHPTASYVFSVILPYEAARAGASLSTLTRRVSCESHGNWWANNGQYNGIGQFSYSTFSRGLGSIGSRRVTVTEVKYRRMHSRVYRYWSDGTITRHKGRVRRQRVTVKRVGTISTAYSDAWTQARIMAQANAGKSAVNDGEWSCR